MKVLALVAGLALLLTVLWDAFETIILPRRVMRRLRLTRLFYRSIWKPWSVLARRMRPGRRRDAFLSYFGPLSLLLLFGVWFLSLILSFALLHWGAGSSISIHGERPSFGLDLYLSGTTFFTLGLGDVTPLSGWAKLITVAESGTGFGLLAIVIAYLPVLYSAFSRREVNISLLDARAGSPPTAMELLRRHAPPERAPALIQYLRDWESWSAELMESHLSYPILCYFRSQHSNQSWLAALAAILDASALLSSHGKGNLQWQAQLTFAIARHAVVDLSQVVDSPPRADGTERLAERDLDELRTSLADLGMLLAGTAARENLSQLRQLYEPYLNGLAARFMLPLPVWAWPQGACDNWQRSAWQKIPAARRGRKRAKALKDVDPE